MVLRADPLLNSAQASAHTIRNNSYLKNQVVTVWSYTAAHPLLYAAQASINTLLEIIDA